MIQDQFRAQVFLRNCASADSIRVVYFPIAMSGSGLERAAVSPSSNTNGTPLQRPSKILFFGGLWRGNLLNELEAVANQLREGQVLVIQGGRGSLRPREVDTPRLVISTRLIPFDKINEYIASADVGLAVYPEREANNSRYTAFASEKVARYAQCGIPFIAFRSEDYEYLRAETGCCELVSEYSEIPDAVNTILKDYDHYQRGAFAAYRRFYCLETSGTELLREISKPC
jgi:hypothetical protein